MTKMDRLITRMDIVRSQRIIARVGPVRIHRYRQGVSLIGKDEKGRDVSVQLNEDLLQELLNETI